MRDDELARIAAGDAFVGPADPPAVDPKRVICAETMRLNGWRNADVLPGVKVNSGANFRLIELIQQGYIEIHP